MVLTTKYQQDFLPINATAAAYVYFTVHGVAALGKGGRTLQCPGMPKDSVENYCAAMASIHP